MPALNPEPQPDEPAPVDRRDSGGSLMHDYDRRVTDRRVRTRRVLFNRRSHAERRATKRVQELCGGDVLLLQHRKLGPGRRDGNIDLVAIGPAGVYVVDVKAYQGKKVELRISGGLFSQGQVHLVIGGRDSTRMVDALGLQLDAVRAALRDVPDQKAIPVTTALCFVDADLPLFQTLSVGGVPCLRPKATARLLATPGPFDAAARAALHAHLEKRLPPTR